MQIRIARGERHAKRQKPLGWQNSRLISRNFPQNLPAKKKIHRRASAQTRHREKKPKPCERKTCFILPFLPVGPQESVLKQPKQGQFHDVTRVTPKRCCDSCVQGAIEKRTAMRRNLYDAESLAKRCGKTGN